MIAGVGIMALLGGLVLAALALALAAVWWFTTGRGAGAAEVREAGTGALVVPADGTTHLTSTLGDEPVAGDAPAPGLAQAAEQRLRELDDLLAQGLIDREEYAATRAAILGTL